MPSIDVAWWRPFWTISNVTVVHIDLSSDTVWEGEAITWLDDEEQARRRRFEYDGPRRRFTLCRAALRAILCEEHSCENAHLAFRTDKLGKPYALVQGEPAGASFNVSHSGDHGLVAYAPAGHLGVDIEERDTRRDFSFLVETVLGPEEQAALALAEGQERTNLFYTIWTLKEAVLKALGKGFAMDATGIRIPPAMLRGRKNGVIRLPDSPAITLHVEDFGNREFAAAVAFELHT